MFILYIAPKWTYPPYIKWQGVFGIIYDVTTQPATVMISLNDFPSKKGITYKFNIWYIFRINMLLLLTCILICRFIYLVFGCNFSSFHYVTCITAIVFSLCLDMNCKLLISIMNSISVCMETVSFTAVVFKIKL